MEKKTLYFTNVTNTKGAHENRPQKDLRIWIPIDLKGNYAPK